MNTRLIRRTGWLVLALGAATATSLEGCGSSDSSKSCETGSEGCVCFANNTCATGLSCYSNLCVAVGTGSAGSDGSGGNGNSSGAGNAKGGRSSNDSGGRGQAGDSIGGANNEGGDANPSGGVTTDGGASPNAGAPSAHGGAPDPAKGGASATQGGAPPAQGGAAQGGTTAAHGGVSNGQGGTTTGQGGTATGQGGTVTGSGGTSNEVSDPHIIDNFSSCDNAITRVAGRDGYWYAFGDNDVNITPNTQGANPAPAVSSPPSAFSSSNCAAWVTGGCAATADQCAYAGNGFTFRADRGPYDISAYTGVQFDFEGDELWVVVIMTSGNSFGTTIAASPAARRTRSFNFSDLVHSAETPASAVLDLTHVRQIEFTATKPSGFGQAIWDVRFF